MSLFLYSELTWTLELEQIDEQLKQADSLKSSDSEMFSEILLTIEPEFNKLSNKQKYYFLYLSGYSSAYKGKVKDAISKYKHVEKNSEDTELRYRASLSLANLYALKKNWQNGFEYLEYISNEYHKILNVDIRHQGLIAAAIFYNELEQYETTKIFTRRLLDEQVTGRNLCMTLGVKLKAELSTSNLDSLEQEILNAIDTCVKINELVVVNVLRTYLASYYLTKNNPERVIELLESHIKEVKDSHYQFLIVETSSLLAKAYLEIKDIDNAEKYALIVTSYKDTNQYLKTMVNAYEVLSVIAKQNKSFDSAFAYQDKYIQSKESLFEQTKAKQLAVESAKHRAVERDNQIDLLNQQNQILQLEKNISKKEATANRWIISLLILSVSLMILWLFYIKRSQQRLKYLAEYDGLTRVCNRTHFTESATTVLKTLSKSNLTVSLIMFDLDHFKKINDAFGHFAGDKALQLAAHSCSSCARKVDIFGRIGGEEFAIVLPGCDKEQAMKIAEECRQKLNQINLKESGCDIPVSASFGVTETQSSGYDLKDLMAHADEAMYQAKNKGRNQVIFWEDAAA